MKAVQEFGTELGTSLQEEKFSVETSYYWKDYILNQAEQMI